MVLLYFTHSSRDSTDSLLPQPVTAIRSKLSLKESQCRINSLFVRFRRFIGGRPSRYWLLSIIVIRRPIAALIQYAVWSLAQLIYCSAHLCLRGTPPHADKMHDRCNDETDRPFGLILLAVNRPPFIRPPITLLSTSDFLFAPKCRPCNSGPRDPT